jgi:ABC-2 type transport system permease protein
MASVEEGAVVAAGPFAPLARAQYGALTSMRWSMFRHGLRKGSGAMELGAHIIIFVLYGIMGIGLGAGMGGGAYAIVSMGKLEMLPTLMWVVFVLWQLVPVSLASFQEQFDMGGLLRFPVGFGAFYLLHLIFGLIDISSILGTFCCVGILVGVTVARPDLAGWVSLGLVVFAAFNVFLVRAIFAWIDRWLAQRKTREIVSAVFLVGLLSLQFLNPAFHSKGYGRISAEKRVSTQRWFKTANDVQRWLPPGLAAEVMKDGAAGRPGMALESLGGLGLYLVLAGGTLGIRLKADYRGESLSDAPSRSKGARKKTLHAEESGRSVTWLLDRSGPIAAVMEKEMRTLVRSLPLLYGIGAPLLMVFVLSGLYRNRGSMGGHASALGLLISLAYAMVGFTQILYNNLGAEGAGAQILFLSPTPIRTVILGKNLFHAALFIVDAVLVVLLASLRMGRPEPLTVAAAGAWLLFALPVHMACGNLFSLKLPYKMNLGRIGRQKGSQASSLLSMLIQLGVLGLGAGVMALCAWLGVLWVAVVVFLGLAVMAALAWMLVLANVDRIANERRDALIGTLVKAD